VPVTLTFDPVVKEPELVVEPDELPGAGAPLPELLRSRYCTATKPF
jgi:hypothetical protein